MLKIGIIREGKVPPDSRVALTPQQAKMISEKHDIEFVIQPSEGRCIPDQAYKDAGLNVAEDLSDCSVLMGIKEVPVDQLIADKTYFFFSHTIKEQSYNRKLLKAVLKKNIRLLDYEVLTQANGRRVLAFGRFAGIVGAHNGMMAYGKRTGAYALEQMHKYDDYAAAQAYYKGLEFPKMKIVVTGAGRVANGAVEVLDHMNIRRVSPQEFLTGSFDEAVYTQLDCGDYAAHKDGGEFQLLDFFKNPQDYVSIFAPYTKVADVMINGIYWDNQAPQFFTAEDMKQDAFNIQVIADVTCDIAPAASIPSTLFAATIANPVFGYDPNNQSATDAYQAHTVDMMTIDNLPNELPKDASESFGEQFIESVLEELLGTKDTGMIERATIADKGQLGKHFDYLHNYAFGE
ncbi:MAG: NAD(P)-dependent oxidoreductase [Saprospiraceae bacterium]|nr:NAD(P)-dependent oxidoreductase [Saprospiraceae bacterium]